MDSGQKAALGLVAVFVMMAWSSPWFEIKATGTYTEGLDREPTIRTQYAIDNDQQTFELTIDNATPLLVYWMQREDVTSQPDTTEGSDEESTDLFEEESSADPCSGSCMDLVRNSLGLLMVIFLGSLVAATRSSRVLTRASVGASWLACLLVIIIAVPLAAAADFGIFSGGREDTAGSSTGGFDSKTEESVSADQFAHFSSDADSRVSMAGLVFTYDSIGYDLGLLEEGDRQGVIETAPQQGEPGYESLIRFHGELVAGPGPIVSWWFLTLPLMIYILLPSRPTDEEE